MDNDGGRTDDQGWSPEPDDDWIFDLPGGAWERHQEKNRLLRERAIRRLTEQRRDPLAGRPADPGNPGPPAEPDDLPLLRRTGRRRPAEPGPGDASAAPPSTGGDAARSRWDEVFGTDSGGGSIVDGMRDWVERSRARTDATRGPREGGLAGAGPLEGAPGPAGADASPGLPSDEAPPAAQPPANAPSSEPPAPTAPLRRASGPLFGRLFDWTSDRDQAPAEPGAQPVLEPGETGPTPVDGPGPVSAPLDEGDAQSRPAADLNWEERAAGDAEAANDAEAADDAEAAEEAGASPDESPVWSVRHPPLGEGRMLPGVVEAGTEHARSDVGGGAWAPAWTGVPAEPDGTGNEEPAVADMPPPSGADHFRGPAGDELELPAEREARGSTEPVEDAAIEAVEEPGAGLSHGPSEAISQPLWKDETPERDEDVVWKAFKAHAAAADPVTSGPRPREPRTEDLAALLGEEADDLVAAITPRTRRAYRDQRAEDWGSEFMPRVSAPDEDGASVYRVPLSEPRAEDIVAPAAPSTAQGRRHGMVRGLIETSLLAILVFLAVRASFQNFRVDGNSMYPTLEDGEFLIVNKLAYSEVDMEKLGKFLPFIDAQEGDKRFIFSAPDRGDIIVLRDPRRPDQDLIKRIVGLPGETIEIRDGHVFVNDFLLEEPYIADRWSDNRPKLTVPEGHYYVLGDNRENSLDSRSNQVGLIPQGLIVGKAIVTYWPFDRFGLAPNEPGQVGGPELTTTRIEERFPSTVATR